MGAGRVEPASVLCVERLLASPEPAIRLRTLENVLGVPPSSPEVRTARARTAGSERVARLLSQRGVDGTIPCHPYSAKWYGAHWVLVTLAELGYPAGDRSLLPLREQALGWLMSDEYRTRHIGRVRGRGRLHASIDGNMVWALLRLGLADERVERLVARLLDAQWPDGGWNCDRRASGRSSSFTESLVPLRGLALHARLTADPATGAAVSAAAEFFLRRRLYRRVSDGTPISPSFQQLHFPCYWHYDVLFGLTALAEAGVIGDLRCDEALGLLQAKRLPDGGFPAEARFYRVTGSPTGSGRSLVDWGPTGRRCSNEWVTTAALAVQTSRSRAGALAAGASAPAEHPRL